ncbi:hypothetical protein R1sor_024964 [Riccia sorocarpa]|uniref:Uncharacterized protein n=1 Tax=Riccia sorocarpa TaxID=122646 RepID=A0ABD3G8R9_9MARC
MKGYEQNYDFGDLLDCASGLNRLAALEYGEEAVKVSKGHVKQRTLWAKLHPLPPDQTKPDLADFGGLETDEKICSVLQVGLLQAQSLLTQLNMSPHAGVRIKTWWKSPWTLEKELGLFGRPSNTEELEDACRDIHDMENPGEFPELSTDLWDIPQANEIPSGMDTDVDETNDLEVYGHETYSDSKQSVYFNGVKPKPRVEGVPVCIIDVGSDCGVLFDTPYGLISSSKIKFTYDNTDLQWIDLESVITVVSLKMESIVRILWTLDNNDRARINEFIAGL